MNDKVLLLLGISSPEDAGVAIETTSCGRDVKVKRNRGEGKAVAKAFGYAKATSKKVVVLQILTSDLYHYGYNDLILSGGAKTCFLSYVRSEVLRLGEEKARRLEEMARKRDISLEMRPVESDDPVSTAIEEAGKGYKMIFLPKEKKRLFPLLKRQTLEEKLRKKDIRNIVTC